jgi:hypothetical protein
MWLSDINFHTRTFEWSFENNNWTMSSRIPKATYESFRKVSVSQRLEWENEGFSAFATTRDPAVMKLAARLNDIAVQERYTRKQTLEFILAFVQNIHYEYDKWSTGYEEYPKFPIEILVDGEGDCEDHAILLATLLLLLKYDVIFISPPEHVAVGVSGSEFEGHYWILNGQKYYYCETTGPNFEIGDLPDEEDDSAELYEIDENKQYIP